MSDTATPDGDGLKRSIMDRVDSRTATLLYRASSFLLLCLLSVLGVIATGALGYIKDLTKSVNELNARLIEVIGTARVTTAIANDHERRIGRLEDWRATQPNTRSNP